MHFYFSPRSLPSALIIHLNAPHRACQACVGGGASHVVLHARSAILSLSPLKNRQAPPLRSAWAARLASVHPELRVTLNGGIAGPRELAAVAAAPGGLDGVMVGRWMLRDPFALVEAEAIVAAAAAARGARAGARGGRGARSGAAAGACGGHALGGSAAMAGGGVGAAGGSGDAAAAWGCAGGPAAASHAAAAVRAYGAYAERMIGLRQAAPSDLAPPLLLALEAVVERAAAERDTGGGGHGLLAGWGGWAAAGGDTGGGGHGSVAGWGEDGTEEVMDAIWEATCSLSAPEGQRRGDLGGLGGAGRVHEHVPGRVTPRQMHRALGRIAGAKVMRKAIRNRAEAVGGGRAHPAATLQGVATD